MLKRNMIMGILLGCVVPIGFTALQVSANTVSYQSQATVDFVENTDVTPPVNPTDPTDPLKPVKPVNPGTQGPLLIDYVSNIQFSQQQISGKDSVYYAQLDQLVDKNGKVGDYPNYVQVTDNRGSNAGWKMTVAQAQPFMNGKNQLDGTVIALMNGTMSGTNAHQPTPASKAEIKPDGQAVSVMTAKTDNGVGTWTERFGKDNTSAKQSISLFVPAESKKVAGAYKSELTWTLTDTNL
ncbi:WxL domain-containing protein [Dellaglioa algida]|uniref:WxL domain-containing protein n=1 Tax=Dellaglioa algida TaxID=105612 RepID=UPI0024DE381D|nr:WxL domain-containing protein [Dellaglioa algida]MDK1739988.1 WxL domain-containing protein [Dellaglioa algida]